LKKKRSEKELIAMAKRAMLPEIRATLSFKIVSGIREKDGNCCFSVDDGRKTIPLAVFH